MVVNVYLNQLQTIKTNEIGPVRESNPGPLAPKARIMPLDQQARRLVKRLGDCFNLLLV